MANPQPHKDDDTVGYYLGLVMFSIAIPIIAGVGYWMALNMRDVDRTTLQLQVAPAAASEQAAEEPAEAAGDEAPSDEAAPRAE